jgi:dTDP-4-amino-4,6-dideoxy-D-galactose acyltransferase
MFSPFIRLQPSRIFEFSISSPILDGITKETIKQFRFGKDESIIILYKYLDWDSNYFGVKTINIQYILYTKACGYLLVDALNKFLEKMKEQGIQYCFSEIPSEDIEVIQSLGSARFKLIETRMIYSLDLNKHDYQRCEVRKAEISDIDNLKRVARQMRNPFDRFHADPIFSEKQADEFLATYIEESVKGLADIVLVPNSAGVKPNAFLTGKYLKEYWEQVGLKASKMVLSAVSSDTCKGWYIKLISELAYNFKEEGADYAFLHPAATNRAVIFTYEKLGCRLGQTSHIFSIAL